MILTLVGSTPDLMLYRRFACSYSHARLFSLHQNQFWEWIGKMLFFSLLLVQMAFAPLLLQVLDDSVNLHFIFFLPIIGVDNMCDCRTASAASLRPDLTVPLPFNLNEGEGTRYPVSVWGRIVDPLWIAENGGNGA
jgi:hypothetical protein